MKILGTGLSGLIGSRLIELLKDYTFENLSLETGCDITDKKSVLTKIQASDASCVLHLAAKTDVDSCEQDKEKDQKGSAWVVNVLGTRSVVEACIQSGKRLIYVSTDFVFDGESPRAYEEEDLPSPINWYGKTKYEGEKIVQNSPLSWSILRVAYPYRAFFMKEDFMRGILRRFTNKNRIAMITDHIMTPTFIDDIVKAVYVIIDGKLEGKFHVVGSQFVTPYEAALMIASVFQLDSSLIGKTTRKEYFKGKAPRPYRLALKNDKIQKLGIKMSTFEEGLLEIKKQMKSLIS